MDHSLLTKHQTRSAIELWLRTRHAISKPNLAEVSRTACEALHRLKVAAHPSEAGGPDTGHG